MPKQPQFNHERHTCTTGVPCRFLSEHEENPAPALAERLAEVREARREKVRKTRGQTND
ncbi:hypothetical protein [Micromonospora sp. NPDC005087]|uniref:hypothetical protein n=1 Tax=Micromonospora sp. NPDC005087 TaxID=3364225 RepID=UPI0036BD4C46